MKVTLTNIVGGVFPSVPQYVNENVPASDFQGLVRGFFLIFFKECD
jgi:hypothetical protein